MSVPVRQLPRFLMFAVMLTAPLSQAQVTRLLAVHDRTIYIANLRGERLRAIPVADPTAATDLFIGEFGRLRAVASAPDGSLWFVTGNMNSRVSPRLDDDHIMRLDLP